MNETEPLPTTPTDNESTAARPRRNLRPVIIGVASGLAVLALGVGGAVIADSLDGSGTAVVVASRDDSISTAPTTTATPVPAPSPSSSGSDDRGGSGSGHSGSDGSDDSKAPISASEYDAVAAAAIAAAGGSGTIEELKREDDGAVAWEVDVRLSNGAKVEVELAADLTVLSTRIDD